MHFYILNVNLKATLKYHFVKIKQYLINIAVLLKEAKESHWADIFESLITNFDEIELNENIKRIKRLYAGMASFNDLVLHKNEIPCVQENELLDYYRKELFKEISTFYE